MVGEHVPIISEIRDNEGGVSDTGLPGAAGGGMRQRRKIERNTSAPLPGMLQVIVIIMCASKSAIRCNACYDKGKVQ